jgi:hypothetical protein
MYPVVLSGQDYVKVLQNLHPIRQPEVSVRPLVDLKRQNHCRLVHISYDLTHLVRDCNENRAEEKICTVRIFGVNSRH